MWNICYRGLDGWRRRTDLPLKKSVRAESVRSRHFFLFFSARSARGEGAPRPRASPRVHLARYLFHLHAGIWYGTAAARWQVAACLHPGQGKSFEILCPPILFFCPPTISHSCQLLILCSTETGPGPRPRAQSRKSFHQSLRCMLFCRFAISYHFAISASEI